RKKVWLKSGGYIVIDQTEALTTIDVNTGRFVGKHTLEDTILKTNLEAVKEIVHQLRFRNIGGIIILDFIDMESPAHRERLQDSLRDALKEDKAKTQIENVSGLGLIEMTRKRTRKSLREVLCEPCSYCDGKGYVKSTSTTAYRVLRELRKEIERLPGDRVVLHVHPDVADLLDGEEKAGLADLGRRWKKSIVIRPRTGFHVEQFDFAPA
ncbi:MAG: ribonuclease E/G, partial [Vicinamibacteria bacterium]